MPALYRRYMLAHGRQARSGDWLLWGRGLPLGKITIGGVIEHDARGTSWLNNASANKRSNYFTAYNQSQYAWAQKQKQRANYGAH